MINPLTLLTSPLEKGLAAAVAVLLVTSGSEALVIKYEMNSKTQCVSAVTATNAETKTVTTAIRNVDNASNQTIQASVSSGIAADIASLRNNQSLPSGSGMSALSGSPAGTPTAPVTSGTPTESNVTYTTDEASAEACLTAYDVAVGWQQWYNQTQSNWQNVENTNGSTHTTSDLGGTSQPEAMAHLRLPVPSPIWFGVGLGEEDVRQEQPVRDQGDGGAAGNGSSDTRSEQQGTAVRDHS